MMAAMRRASSLDVAQEVSRHRRKALADQRAANVVPADVVLEASDAAMRSSRVVLIVRLRAKHFRL
jgi:hypothetical protein